MPKVGRWGQAASKNRIGKLLEMPPSENHTVTTPASSGALLWSTAWKGSALIKPGKLKLIRAATTRGTSGAEGIRCSGWSGWMEQVVSAPVVEVTGALVATMWLTTRDGKYFAKH